MRAVGTVLAIQVTTAGSWTTGANLTSSTTLTIQDMSDFREEGGTAVIDPLIVDGVFTGGTEVAYTAAVDDEDGDYLTLTLPLTADVDDRTSIAVSPLVQYKTALVDIGGGLVYECDIPSGHLWSDSRLAETTTGGQSVLVEPDDTAAGTWTVVGIGGSAPVIDLGHADPEKPMPAGTIAETFAQREAELPGALPASLIGGGRTNATIDFAGKTTIGGVSATAQGTAIRQESGGTSFLVDPDGTVHAGGSHANFDDIVSRQTLLGGETRGAAGGQFILEDTGLLASPSQPPTTDYSWLSATIDLPATVPARTLRALGVKDNTHAFALLARATSVARVVLFNPTAGTYTSRDTLTGAPTETVVVDADYASMADCYQTLEYDAVAGEWLVRYYDWTTQVFDHEWVATALGSAQYPQPAIASFSSGGHEYTKIFRSNAVDADTPGTINIWRYDNEVPAGTPLSVTTDSFPFYDIGSAAVFGGAALITGLTNMVATTGDYIGQPVIPVIDMGFPGSGLAFGDTLGYLTVANGDLTAAGLGAIDTDTTYRSWYLSAASGAISQQSNVFEAGEYWTAVTYFDFSTSDETAFDPALAALQTKVPGALVTYTVGAPPPGSDADSMRVYLARDLGAGVPARTSFWLQSTSFPGNWDTTVFTVLTAGTNPPAVGTIASGAAYEFRTSGGTLLMDGSGFIAGGGGGTPLGGVDIDCGTASATGVEIDCGVA